jgi:hypothetical protein
MSSAFMEFGFGENDDGVGIKSKRYKGKEGETTRVSFVYWKGLEEGKPEIGPDAKSDGPWPSPKFIGCKRLYVPGVGYFMDKGPEWVKLAGGAPSKMYCATILCVWPTDSRGTLDQNRFAAGQFEVMPWIMSTDKYRAVEARHKEFPLGCHDMTLACTDSQYQKIDISPCKEGLFRKLLEKSPARAKQIIEAAAAVAATLSRDIAQDLSLDQIREKLGKGGGPSPVGGGGGAVASNSADFDGMLDDMLK